MTQSPSNFFNYFKECYKLDYKEFVVNNILNPKYKFKWFNNIKEELLNHKLPIFYYDNKEVEKLEKDLELYKLEKSLYYGAFFIIGHQETSITNRDNTVCSPLVLFPCEIIEKDEDKYIKINQNEFVLNTSILNKIATNETAKEKLETKLTQLFSGIIEDGFEIKKAFDDYTKNIDTSELSFYPQNWNISKIRKALKSIRKQDQLKIVPASGTVFITKSLGSTKVISDLNAIAQKNHFNTALNELFSQQNTTDSIKKSYLKHRLNTEQFKALNNSQKFKNSVIIGPPGTGKSYTIGSIAVDAITKGKSVLIVSKTKQAVEVVRQNLTDDFNLGKELIHTSGNRYKVSLIANIKRKLSGIVPKEFGATQRIKSLDLKSKELIQNFEDILNKELELSNLAFKEKLSFREYFRKLYLHFNENDNLAFLKTVELINKNNDLLNKELKYYVYETIKHITTKSTFLNRPTLSLYYDALKTSNFSESQKIIDSLEFREILEIYPLWLANLSELNTVFPQEREMFDLVIIDEATQCDIATALPAIYRAKKVIISGDPNQLRHYSFIGNKQQLDLQHKYKLAQNPIFDYRNKSVLDLFIANVANQEQVSFLREHYRSTPSLIEFNNQEFYDQQLEIIKSTTDFTSKKQLEINYIDGTRNSKGININEAERILEKIIELIVNDPKNKNNTSIGVIAFFGDQAKYINKLISQSFDLKTIKTFNILCGTPYHFQGSEKEIILISFTVCNKTHHSAFTHLNKSEVLNVGTTRAKSFQYIYTSVKKQGLKKDSLFRKYLDFIEHYQYQHENETTEQDLFQQEIAQFLKENAVEKVHCSYPYAGEILDVFFSHNHKKYFIDLIGYPGQFNNAFSIERYKTFNRIGIYVIPLHYRFWKEDNKLAKKTLNNIIQDNNHGNI